MNSCISIYFLERIFLDSYRVSLAAETAAATAEKNKERDGGEDFEEEEEEMPDSSVCRSQELFSQYAPSNQMLMIIHNILTIY